MTAIPRRTPSYRHFKPRNLAVVRLDGRDHYLGRYDSPESRQKYHRLIAEWLESRSGFPAPAINPVVAAAPLLVKELVLHYDTFAATYYVKGDRTTTEFTGIREAMRRLLRLDADTAVDAFGPKSLKRVREQFIADDLCRRVINQHIGRIKRMFKWGVEQELVPVTVYQALMTVPDLRKGRTVARESQPVEPVDPKAVKAALKFLPAPVRAMVELQQLTGCRPGEICRLRPCDVDRSGKVWCYRPAEHKTQHHLQERRIFLGPRAQKILRPWLKRAPEEYCFSPAESRRAFDALRRRNRQTPMTPSHARRTRVAVPRKRPGTRYTPNSYRQAVEKACVCAKIKPWSPNRLRHARATELRRLYGLEASQTVLGHRQAFVTQIYAERDFGLAERVMEEQG